MPVHQNVNILHGLVGPNAVQPVVVVKNHVIANVIVRMDILQISAKIMVNAMANQEKKKIAIRTLNVHQNVNSVRIGNHGCPAQRLVEAEPKADRKNVNARTLTNAKVAKEFHQPITLNVTLNHALAGVIGLHGQNVPMHVAKMSALGKETISANTFPLQRAKLWKLKSVQVTVVTGAAGTNGQNVTIHVMKVQEPDHVNVTVHPAHQSTNVHVLVNQMNRNHVTFHHAKTSAILVSGVAGLIVIPNVVPDNKLVFEHATARPVLNALFQPRNHVNVLKMNKLNVLRNQLVIGHHGVTGPIAVVIVETKPGPGLECVTVVTNQNVRQRIRNVQDQI